MLYTFFDTETSGLENDCDVLSFSYMLADENLNIRKAETLYFWKEGVTKWSQEAYEINKLSKEFLRQYESDYDKNLQKMYLYLCFASLVGYNSGWVGKDGVIHGFDFPRCKSFLVRNGYPEPRPMEYIDVMKMSELSLGRRYKLTVAFNKLGLSEEVASAINSVYFGADGKAHESSFDTVLTAMLFQKLYANGHEEMTQGVTWAVVQEKESKQTEWMLFFEDADLKALKVVTDGEDETVTVFTMAELMEKNIQVFDYLMGNPNLHMCQDKDLLSKVEGGYVNV